MDQHIIDVLDEVSLSSTPDPLLRRKCSLVLDRVCSSYGALPTRYPRAGNVIIFGDRPGDDGGSADVWRGELNDCPVAVKVTRRYSTVPMAHYQEQFYREILIWGRMSHPNVLPLLGVDTRSFPPAAISAWMQHGNLRQYLIHFPSASRLKLLLDASRGLEYMHGLEYVHGDLKSLNVLIDGHHCARLADFGSSSILPLPEPDAGDLPAPVGDKAFSVRWLAPELIYPEGYGLSARVCSKESDVYSFSMLIYEVFSGLFPFEGYRDEGVILRVMSGTRPDRPQGSLGLGLTDSIWKMMQECWGSSDRRWTISRIASCFESSITPTVKVVGSGGRAEPRSQAFSTLTSHSGFPSASAPGSEVARHDCRKNVFRALNQLFRI